MYPFQFKQLLEFFETLNSQIHYIGGSKNIFYACRKLVEGKLQYVDLWYTLQQQQFLKLLFVVVVGSTRAIRIEACLLPVFYMRKKNF